MDKIREIVKAYKKIDIECQQSDFSYWKKLPCEKRLASLEEIRREFHGWKDDSEQRLQRVFRIVKQ